MTIYEPFRYNIVVTSVGELGLLSRDNLNWINEFCRLSIV